MELIILYQVDLGPHTMPVGMIKYIEDGNVHCSLITIHGLVDVAFEGEDHGQEG